MINAYVTLSVFSTTEPLLWITRSLTWFFMLNCHANNVLHMYKLYMCGHITEAFHSHTLHGRRH